jgi:hypothetical protein
MPKFTLESTDPAIDTMPLEARTWSGALSKVISRFRSNGGLVRVNVDDEGHADLWEDETGVCLHLEADPDTGFEMFDDPTTELWDAPIPGSGARVAKAPSPEDQARVQEGLQAIHDAETPTAASDAALDLLLRRVPAESGSVLLADEEQLRFVAVRGPKSDQLLGRTLSRIQGVAGVALQSGTTLLIRRAHSSNQHDASVDRSIGHITRTLLAVPLIADESAHGVLELLNPFGGDTFAPDHQGIAREVCDALSARLAREL